MQVTSPGCCPAPPDPPSVRLIALDLDGTLLASSGTVSERNRNALAAATAAGIEIVIATGRRHTYAMRQLHALDLPPEAVLVSSNGAVVRTLAADLLERSRMTPASCERLFAEMGEFRNALVVTFDRVGPDGEDERGALVVEELAELHTSIERWMAANEPYLERINPIEDSLQRGEPIQMMLCGTIERMRRAEERLRSILGVSQLDDMDASQLDDMDLGGATGLTPDAAEKTGAEIVLHRTEYPARDLSIVDILPAGASKGAALARLAASRGFTIDAVMAIGDNWNDLPMLRVVGTPVLMGNAPAELLERARGRGWWLTRTNDQDGVAEAIEAVLARQARSQPAIGDADPASAEMAVAAAF